MELVVSVPGVVVEGYTVVPHALGVRFPLWLEVGPGFFCTAFPDLRLLRYGS